MTFSGYDAELGYFYIFIRHEENVHGLGNQGYKYGTVTKEGTLLIKRRPLDKWLVHLIGVIA